MKDSELLNSMNHVASFVSHTQPWKNGAFEVVVPCTAELKERLRANLVATATISCVTSFRNMNTNLKTNAIK
eukprot:g66343.t1